MTVPDVTQPLTGRPVLEVRSDAFLADPQPRLDELRGAAGVCPVDHGGTPHGGAELAAAQWVVVTRADLARSVLRDPETFSSKLSKHVAPPAEVADQVAAIRSEGWPYTAALGASDAPEHTVHRKLVNRAFTPRRLAAMEPIVRQAAEELAAKLPDGQEIDFLAAFGEHLPVLAISRVLGLPDERYQDIRRWSRAAVSTIGASPSPEEWVGYERDLLDYQQTMAALLERGKSEELPGVIGGLAAAAAEAESGGGAPWDMGLLLTLMRELVVAGNETTGKFLAETIRRIGDDPQVWQRLRDEPSYSEQIVEESLRLATPTQSVMRRVTTATELDGVLLEPGTLVLVSLASSNRDEEAFPDPDAFDADRSNVRNHLAFGIGVHACLGSVLARMESRIALEVLATTVERIEPSDRPPVYSRSYTIRGPVEMFATVHRL